MLHVINDRRAIDAVESALRRLFQQECRDSYSCYLTNPEGRFRVNAYWFPQYGFWASLEVAGNNRYWNAFGLEAPEEGKALRTVCEVNLPFTPSRRVAGVALSDLDRHTVLAHTGRIGGGGRGVGRHAFEQYFTGSFVEVDDGRIVAPICALGNSRFFDHLAWFVREVNRIKTAVKEGTQVGPTDHSDKGTWVRVNDTEVATFSREFSGSKSYTVIQQVTAVCDHGLVTNRLAEVLKERGFAVGNDQFRDLYILNRTGRISHLFEVKSDSSPTSVYTALGQLMFHSAFQRPEPPRLVAVLPATLSDESIRRMKAVGVSVLRYEFTCDGSGVKFDWTGTSL